MSKMTKKTILYFILIVLPALIFAQDDWEIKKENDDITVYTRPSQTNDFDEYKATTTVDFSMSAFLNVMWDVEAYPTWIPNMKYSKLLDKKDDTVQIYYSSLKVPFPYENRDVVYYNKFVMDSAKQHLTIHIKALPDYIEKKDGLVRMPSGNGKWEVQSKGDGKLEVSLQMLVDPGGNIPAWLVNHFIANSPYQTLKNLKSFGKKEKYQN